MNTLNIRPRRGVRLGVVAGATALVLGLGLTGCAGDSSAGGTDAAVDQTLTIGFSAEPPGFKTGVDQGSANRQLITLVRRGLLSYGPDGDVVPALASDYEVSEDGLTYTFTLRDGLAFSNGDTLTAADVKRTYEYLAVPENGAADQTSFANIAAIEAPDDTTVVLTLAEPQTALPKVIANPLNAIVPEEPVDANGVPVGAGPFMVTEYKKGVSYTLEADPNYYEADSVELEEIEMIFMADAQTRVKALVSGQVQFIDYVPATDYATIEKTNGVTLDTAYGLYGALQFNLTEGPVAIPEVRQAIAYALDLDAINEVGTLGYGTASGGLPNSEDSEYYDEEQATHYAQDLDKAKELLAEAGFPDGGIHLTLLTNSQYFGHSERAQVVKSDLEKIGITAEIETGDYANLIAKGNNGSYDLMIGGPPAAINDPSSITGAFIGGPTFVRSFGINQDLYADLLAKGAQSPDGAERAEIYHELGEIYLEDVPFVTWGQGTAAYAYTDALEGFEMLNGPIVYSSMYSLAGARLTE